ncbi:MAG TPA: NifB/NifX family molybdenum-iron cluster-binding protein [Candidatus Gastranaerophilales bacterium]|nr:NifB/NifX family molybdenum-iron cluster-binding protein [Candidatus Gastranaerophilales bacterium]
MKIAITSSGMNLEDQVDLRLGRAVGFIIYDLEKDTYNYVDNNQNLNAMQGAGIQAAQNVVNQNVDAIITGNCGPKAFSVLTQAGVKIFIGAEGAVKEAIEKYKNNELQEAQTANVEGHWM